MVLFKCGFLVVCLLVVFGVFVGQDVLLLDLLGVFIGSINVVYELSIESDILVICFSLLKEVVLGYGV